VSEIMESYHGFTHRGDGMTTRIAAVCIFLFITLLIPAVSQAQPMGRGMYQGVPYGHYCPGMQWGPYGVRKPVKTTKEAKEVIESYLLSNAKALHAGKIEEKNWYFEAEILDSANTIIDKAIVDKRSGRIRSIY
jgi:hypothetical protein